MNLWIDVEDLFEYAKHNKRPSGIQRVEFEAGRALAAANVAGVTVHFVRHDNLRQSFHTVPWHAVEQLFSRLTAEASQASDARGAALSVPASRSREALRGALYRLPPSLRPILSQMLMHQVAVFRLAGKACAMIISRVRRMLQRAGAQTAQMARAAVRDNTFAIRAAPGDVLLVLGSPWFHPTYARLAARVQSERGMRLALVIYDLIPIRRPEWCDSGLTRIFRHWMDSVLPLADQIFSISRASAADVAAYMAAHEMIGPEPVPLPMGTGFSDAESAPAGTRRAPSIPPAGSYALIVSTIEARKNHALIVRVWRRLLETMPPEQVPSLVIAGRVGWLVADLMQQLRNADFLGGKVILLEDPTDAELQRLYAGCRFTLFPSFFEGWGLPVSESLAAGRPCFASNATALPEAGGRLARYFNPENGDEAYALIRRVLENPDDLAAWQAEIAREFRPVSWTETAAALIAALAAPQPAPRRAAHAVGAT